MGLPIRPHYKAPMGPLLIVGPLGPPRLGTYHHAPVDLHADLKFKKKRHLASCSWVSVPLGLGVPPFLFFKRKAPCTALV